MKYEYKIIVAGTVLATADTLVQAEHLLEVARNSYLSAVHPRECFFIKRAIKCLTTA